MEEDNKITGNNQKNLFRIRDIVSLILFGVSLLISIYQMIIIFDSTLGHGRIVSYMILHLSLPIMIFLAIGLFRHFTDFVKKSWIFYTFQFLTTIILPLVIVGSVEDRIQEKTLATVKNELTPIITYIDNYKEKNGNVPMNIDNAFTRLPTLRNITYYYSPNIFMLETHVPSIDIDGVKIFYDSRDKHWYKFHNDEYQYYQDKNEKPKSIKNYMSLIKQTKLTKSYIKRSNEQWVNPEQKAKDNSKKKLKNKKERCNLNYGADCTSIGLQYALGLDVNQSYHKALEYYSKACELNHDTGCSYLADLYAKGQGTEQNHSMAKIFYKKACDLGINKEYCKHIELLFDKYFIKSKPF